MLISYNWLNDYVDLSDIDPDKLAYDLTMSTVEVEEIVSQKEKFEHILVGKILDVRQHPDADRLRVVNVAFGGDDVREIVCGGSNLYEGMLCAVAEEGAKFVPVGGNEVITLKNRKIRGILSNGMICAAGELGLNDLFPPKDEKELIDLTSFEFEPGSAFSEAMGLNDYIIEVDNKSLTNRPDLWGHYGIAREFAAIYSKELKPLPEFDYSKGGSQINVEIQSELCSRYIGVVAEGVTPDQAPLWMKVRLVSVGQRPIDLLVDLTNYVMRDVGQPLHAFDSREIPDGKIIVRTATSGETLELLDGTEAKLTTENLVIADSSKPTALAGVMGGAGSGIREDTKQIILEAATFNATNVRRTATALGVRTESSMRFEKGLDSERAQLGVERFFTLLKEIQPTLAIVASSEAYPTKSEAVVVRVTTEFIESRVGKRIEIVEPLKRLGFEVKESGSELEITVPSWRATGDVSIPEDIVEEAARLYGYDNLGFHAPQIELKKAIRQPEYDLERQVKEFCAYSGGLNEVFGYPWVEEQFVAAAGMESEKHLEMCDPPSPEQRRLIISLIPNLLATAKVNITRTRDFGIFEVSKVFIPTGNSSDGPEDLPYQPKMFSGCVAATDVSRAFLRLKGTLCGLFESLPVDGIKLTECKKAPSWATPLESLSVVQNGKEIGVMGTVSTPALRKSGIENTYLAAFEINLDAIEVSPAKGAIYEPIPRFPQVEYDLNLLFEESAAWKDVVSCIEGSDKLLKGIQFIEEYRGKQIEAGKKSLVFKLVLGKDDDTLTSEEAQTAVDKILGKVNKQFGAELR